MLNSKIEYVIINNLLINFRKIKIECNKFDLHNIGANNTDNVNYKLILILIIYLFIY